jgi:membrane-associated phospholipid phosphatase
MRRYLLTIALLFAGGALPAVAAAQEASPASSSPAVADAASTSDAGPLAGTSGSQSPLGAAGATSQSAEHGSAFGRFVKDVGGDYKHYFSRETAAWYAAGGGAAAFVHTFDERVAEELSDPTPTIETTLEGGDTYGNLAFQVPIAIGWWVTGRAMGSSRAMAAGRDLVRAQISATSWNYAIKFAVQRTRPNGDPRSFPSGHATATFATAMVLQDHYGWKVGVPFFAGATYTAISRLSIDKHWASDVTMGAFVGIASARTVTLHLRDTRFALAPYAVPHGWAVGLVAVP